jgi:asparagine synthase (glutamine-hydrolysing)
VGVYLSGGIDSALVAAHVRRLAPTPPHAFTVSFVDMPAAFDEGRLARLVAETVGVKHHVLEATTEQLWNALQRCLWHCEQPLVNLAPVGKYLLSDLAQGHVRVVLTGEGSDEIFLGYDYFDRALQAVGRRFARRVLGRLGTAARHTISAIVLRCLFVAGRPGAHAGLFSRQSQDKSQLQGRHPAIALQYRKLKTELRNVILVSYGDRTEMAHSIEGRLPFLDHRLFELARRMPIDVKISGGVEKHVVREAARGLVPDAVRTRKKWRFSTPVPDMGARSGVAGKIITKHLSRKAVSRARIVRYGSLVVVKALRRLPPLRGACNRLLFRVCCLQILFSLFAGQGWGNEVGGFDDPALG